MNKKLSIFLEIAGELNRHKISPILYGSLGVSRLIKINDIDDIDIVVPNEWLDDKFTEFKKIMEGIGFKQDLKYPHEFNREKRDGHVGFESKGELKKDMGINLKNIKTTEINGVKFGELSSKDYLNVYGKTVKLWEKRIAKMQYKMKELEKLIKQ